MNFQGITLNKIIKLGKDKYNMISRTSRRQTKQTNETKLQTVWQQNGGYQRWDGMKELAKQVNGTTVWWYITIRFWWWL